MLACRLLLPNLPKVLVPGTEIEPEQLGVFGAGDNKKNSFDLCTVGLEFWLAFLSCTLTFSVLFDQAHVFSLLKLGKF